MKVITSYQCDICSREYNHSQDAANCEAQGIANISELPIGFMYPYYHHDFVGIFAIAEVEQNQYDKHFVSFVSYAARTSKYPPGVVGEHLGEMCGGNTSFIIPEKFKKDNRMKGNYENTDEFKRMVTALKANNITPCFLSDKGELITL